MQKRRLTLFPFLALMRTFNLLLVIALIAAVLSGCSGKLGEVKTVPAVVTSIADGDTIHVKLDGREEKVRFIGVNCPEIAHPDLNIKEQPYGREAAAYTKNRLLMRKVWLEFDAGQKGKYGRLLAYVWLEQPVSGSAQEVRSKMFNAELLLKGYAQVMTVPPNVKYAGLFMELQREAKEAGRGLWGRAR